jgi:hypothetical protein
VLAFALSKAEGTLASVFDLSEPKELSFRAAHTPTLSSRAKSRDLVSSS